MTSVVKIEMFVKNRNVWQKSKLLSKIETFVKNRNFCQKSNFCQESKLCQKPELSNNRNYRQK